MLSCSLYQVSAILLRPYIKRRGSSSRSRYDSCMGGSVPLLCPWKVFIGYVCYCRGHIKVKTYRIPILGNTKGLCTLITLERRNESPCCLHTTKVEQEKQNFSTTKRQKSVYDTTFLRFYSVQTYTMVTTLYVAPLSIIIMAKPP